MYMIRKNQTRANLAQGRLAQGFTLIELMVTITLIAILIMLAVPAFSTWIHNTQVRTVTESLQNGVRLAQSEALRRNQQVVMSFTNDTNPSLNPTAVVGGKNWSIQTVPSPYINNNEAEPLGAGVLAGVASGVTIAGPAAAICFNANGRLLTQQNATSTTTAAATANCSATGAATFDVSQANSDRPLRVVVQLGGQVRMCDPALPALSTTSPQGC